jgi:TM2 domain-containing membrane protein YozV
MKPSNAIDEKFLVRDRNVIAAALSIIPGAGQMYKGHFADGLILLLFGMPVALWAGILLSLATAGVGMVLPIAVWVWIAYEAFYEEDLRKHHWWGVL